MSWTVLADQIAHWIGVAWKDYLQSTFVTSLLVAMSGAFFGAFAAQRIAWTNKRKDEILKEVRDTSAALAMLAATTDIYIGLKKQFIRSLYDNYMNERRKFEEFLDLQRRKKSSTVKIYEYNVDLQTLKEVHSPVDQIQRIAVERTSVLSPVLMTLVRLANSARSLNEYIEERNRFIVEWQEKKPSANDAPFVYFGIQKGDVVDMRYSTLLEALHQYTDDVIAFSMLSADALYNHALIQRDMYRKISGENGPSILKMDFSQAGDYLPDFANYKEHVNILGLEKNTQKKKRRWMPFRF